MLEQLEFDFKQDSSFICPFCVDVGFQTEEELTYHWCITHPIKDDGEKYNPDLGAKNKTLFLLYKLDDPI